MAGVERFVSVSGGKDSTALYCLMIERGRPFRAVFANTMNEAPETYDYVKSLPARTGGPEIEWVTADLSHRFPIKRNNLQERWGREGVPQEIIDRTLEHLHPTGNVFVDLCMLRSGFPSAKGRFCTDKLKIEPMAKQKYQPECEAGKTVLNFNGTRADESFARSLLPIARWETIYHARVCVIRPILRFDLARVMEVHARFGIQPNPLYERGVDRVGCWPCVFAKKHEITIIARTDPAAIEKLREWEAMLNQVTKWETATFFPARNLGMPKPYDYRTHGIDAQIDWARTSHGGKRYVLEGFGKKDNENAVMEEFETQCNLWGACE